MLETRDLYFKFPEKETSPGTARPKAAMPFKIGTFNLPSTYGTNGEYMSTDGSGNLLFQSGSTPWTTSGNNIYYNTGNVGIGVITPTEKKNETKSH